MAGTHARWSPSGAHRWMPCPGSLVLEEGYGDSTSKYAAEGTAAHDLAARCLTSGLDAADAIGESIEADGFAFTVDQDFAANVQTYLDLVRDLVKSTGGCLLVEQALPLQHLTGEPDAVGTGDAVILTDDEAICIDLKFGRGVGVSAEDNYQLKMYGLGALHLYAGLGEFKRVRGIICQPRANSGPTVSEDSWTVEALSEFASEIGVAVQQSILAADPGSDIGDFLQAGEKQCRFCKAKASCPALRATVAAVMFSEPSVDEFPDLTAVQPDNVAVFDQVSKERAVDVGQYDAEIIGKLLPHLSLVELWCKTVRDRGEELLHAGVAVPGYKLVQGKKGNRAWADADEAEATMKSMRLKHDEMYSYSLISPTTAEKLLKATNPKRWAKLQKLVTQADGKPTVAPESDKRPAIQITPVADDFSDLTAPDADMSDLC